MSDLYAQDWVNVQAGDSFSSYAWGICKQTFANNTHVQVADLTSGKFRWPRWYSIVWLPDDCLFTTVNDGIGTKVELHDAAGTYNQAARDVVAMTWSDITRYGWYPMVFTSVLDVASIWESGTATYIAAQWLIDGLAEIAKEESLVVFNGETAELGQLIGTNNQSPTLAFNRAGTMEWLYHPDKMILWDQIVDGDVIIALQEQWFRSNGISSVRKAFTQQYGEQRHSAPEAQENIKKAAMPSVIYDTFLSSINGWTTPDFQKIIDVHGLVHLSGGSFEWKLLDDILTWRSLEARLDTLYELPDIMRDCAQWRWFADADVYNTWNAWQWMLAIVSPADVELFLCEAQKHWVAAQQAWTISSSPDEKSRVIIQSKYEWGEVVFEE